MRVPDTMHGQSGGRWREMTHDPWPQGSQGLQGHASVRVLNRWWMDLLFQLPFRAPRSQMTFIKRKQIHCRVLLLAMSTNSGNSVSKKLIFDREIFFLLCEQYVYIFPDGTSSKEPGCQCKRLKRCEFNPWVGKILWTRA